MKIKNIDHIVLTVKNIEDTCDFYKKVLGMNIIKYGNGRIALAFDNQKINLHQNESKIKPYAKNAKVGSSDFCLIVEDDINNVKKILEDKGIKIIEGVVQRNGRYGKIKSIYINDPDGNLIELANY